MVSKVHGISIYMGLSTDEKPVVNVFNGDVFDELDTGVKYRFDEGNLEWLAQPTGGGGGGGGDEGGGGGDEGGGGGGIDDGGDKPWSELTWEQVIGSCQTGKYKTFTVGDMKELNLGTEGTVNMQIVGIDMDDLADGSGKAPLTFISKELLATSHRMNPANSGNAEGTGTIGGWDKSEMRTYLNDTIKPLIPQNARSGIKSVTKVSCAYDTSGTKVPASTTTDDVWIPSTREIFGGTSYETSGPIYSGVFTDAESRKKYKVGASSAGYWWLRSAGSATAFRCVINNGNSRGNSASETNYVVLGFCL